MKKSRKKKHSPKIANTINRMWNDYRRVHDIDTSEIKTKNDLVKLLMGFDENYGQYASKINNPNQYIKELKQKEKIIRSIILRQGKTKNPYVGKTSKIQKAIIEKGIKNKFIGVKETAKGYSFYSNRGRYMGRVSK